MAHLFLNISRLATHSRFISILGLNFVFVFVIKIFLIVFNNAYLSTEITMYFFHFSLPSTKN